MIDFVLRNLVELATLPGSVPKLRGFILDQAVRGNLTADWRREHPEVEPASVLLERIREYTERWQGCIRDRGRPFHPFAKCLE